MRIGRVQQKILLTLASGVALGLSRRPDQSFRIIKSFFRAWRDINERSVRDAIRKLYQSKLIDYREEDNGTITLVLSENGKKKSLRYSIDTMKIRIPKTWDRKWRLVLFDIPERFKKERDAFAQKLKQIGFYPLQKSAFIFPYDCKDELDFMIEILNIRRYVRSILVKYIDNELDLRRQFKL